MELYAAPLQGVTTWVFRSVHARLFGGADKYYMPFFSPTKEHLFTARELRDLRPEHNAGIPAVPQIMARNPEHFLWAAGELEKMGYREVNLNLGCPFRTVTAKGKGSGFLAHPEELDAFLDAIFSAPLELSITVKTRLGVQEESEFAALLELYNRYPIAELTIHPRLQRDFYKFPVRREAFAAALGQCRHTVCYNGDLTSPGAVREIHERFPAVNVMVGRGLIADPALFRKVRGGPGAGREELQRFTRTLYEEYRRDYGAPGPSVQRMKELWCYLIHLFGDNAWYDKKLRRMDRPEEYELLETGLFRDLPLLEEPVGQLGE